MTTDPIFWDSFDMYNGMGGNIGLLSRWRAGNIGSTTVMTTGRYGGQGIQILNWQPPSANARYWVDVIFDTTGLSSHNTIAFAWKRDNLFEDVILAVIKDAVFGDQLSFGCDASGRWWAAQGRQGAKYYIASLQATTVNVWNYIALEYVIHSSAGMVNIWANGVNCGGVSGINTNPRGTGNGVILEFVNQNYSGQVTGFVYDDLYISNGTYIDECRAESLKPVVDILSGWVKDSGTSNWSRVSETNVDGDTSYVATATSGARDLYGIASLSSNPARIYGANIVSFGYKTDATTRQFMNSIRSGGVDSDGPSFNMAGNYRRFDRPVLLNPATGLAWDAAAINNLQIGPKMV